MGASKTHNFTKEQNLIANFARVIGHPARVAILEYLVKSNQCICGDLVDKLPLAQATISQHLKELRNIGIIKGQVEGTSIYYCINQAVWNEANEVFKNLFTSYHQVGKI
ncbi:metalloregulator ArsR/SmtB family transcription factor [Fulvivirgaceae bacterium BMA12]|uniref:Metalloregulator ArsR/SmtB family transcription factor n=1 Tax=Agaribacillus aureus TaxID=3051825 RepID=A0ABT8L1B0_9BACT|nr:metalloregulator ArsR/SmtB family transcription factor [Fulvivirgaceae bacterium BMA12]